MTWLFDGGIILASAVLVAVLTFGWIWMLEKHHDVSIADQLEDARIYRKAADPETAILFARAERAKRRNIAASNAVIRYLNTHRPHVVQKDQL